MDLLDLLKVDRRRLPRDTARALRYCERRWLECGRPLRMQDLAEFLDEALRFCTETRMRYPKVLLLRLKQLQRGEWPPREAAEGEKGFVHISEVMGQPRRVRAATTEASYLDPEE